MPKLIVVLKPTPRDDIHNLLNEVQSTQRLPVGVEQVSEGVWTVEFPKCALFFSKLLVSAKGRNYTCLVFEIASPSAWEFQMAESQDREDGEE